MSRATACSAAPDAGAAPPNLLPCDGALFLHRGRAAAGRRRPAVRGAPGRDRLAPGDRHGDGPAGADPAAHRLAWRGGLRLQRHPADARAPGRRRCSSSRGWPSGSPGRRFNSVLLNLYRDGRDSVSWHADNEPGLGRDPVIASLSLGAVRRFQLKHRRLDERLVARPAARLLPDHGRRDPAPLAAPAPQDQSAGRPAHQPHLSPDATRAALTPDLSAAVGKPCREPSIGQ